MDADWSDVPVDVLDGIAVKLITFKDLLAFSAVCHSWYSAYMEIKHRWSPRMPWLMLPENTGDSPDRLRIFFDPSTSNFYRLKLPKALLCWGSAHGWIICVDFTFNIFLFNPLTRARLELPSAHKLPSPWGFPEWVAEDDPLLEAIQHGCQFALDRIVLLKIPPKGIKGRVEEEFLAVSFSDGDGDKLVYIAIAKPNDSTWTRILVEDNRVGHICDVVYRDDGLLLLDHRGAIYHVDLNHGAMNHKSLIATYYAPPFGAILNNPTLDRLYLVESSGNLLAIWRFTYFREDAAFRINFREDTIHALEVEDKDPVYDTNGFYILKFNHETKVWEHLNDLEEKSIFVGFNSTMVVQACKSINCRRNCIYFTNDLRRYYYAPKEFGRHGIGIFSIDDNSGKDRMSSVFKLLYHGKESRAVFCYPLWFFPKF